MTAKKITTLVVASVVLGIIMSVVYVGLIGFAVIGPFASDSDRFFISADGTYVMCDGVKYVAFHIDGDTVINGSFDHVIASSVCREGASFIDNYFIYGYTIYGSADYPYDGVIYVSTAESSDAVTGFFVRETDVGAV